MIGYKFLKSFFPNERFLSLFILLSSAFSIIFILWAEPLFFLIFYLSFYLSYLLISTNKSKYFLIVLFSLFCSLLYYTKPAAGLVFQIAFMLSFLINLITYNKSKANFTFQHFFIIFILVLLFNAYQLFIFFSNGMGIVGYTFVMNEINNTFSFLSFNTLKLMATSLLHQFSYFFIATCGLSFVLFYLLSKYRKLANSDLFIIFFLIFAKLGLIAITVVSYPFIDVIGERMVNGRYYCVLIPLFQIFGLIMLLKYKKIVNFNLLILIIICFIFSLFFSPFWTRNPLVFNSMPDVGGYVYFIDLFQLNWIPVQTEPPKIYFLFSLYSLIIFYVLYYLIKHEKKQKYIKTTIIIMLSMSAVFSLLNSKAIYACAKNIKETNNFYVKLSEMNFDEDKLVYDDALSSDVDQYLMTFWLGKDMSEFKVIGNLNLIPNIDEDKNTFLISKNLYHDENKILIFNTKTRFLYKLP